MSSKYKTNSIKSSPLAASEGVYRYSGVDEKYYKRLFKYLNRYITLSCCDEGIASLLCSAFFEPKVPCNLIGAHLSGVRKAIEPARSELNPSDQATKTMVIYCDNQGAMALAKNPQFHARSKHIDIQHHYVREQVTAGNVSLEYVPTERQVADGLAKALCKDKFDRFRDLIGLEAPP